MKKMIATLRALVEVMEALSKYADPNGVGRLIMEEVRGAISAIRYTEQFPRLPAAFEISGQRDADMFDLLECVFGFQKDNVTNQRENVLLTVANAQSRLGVPVEADPVSEHVIIVTWATDYPSCIHVNEHVIICYTCYVSIYLNLNFE
ncbi:callose synthase 10-like [Prunus dulcis]|uniref:callose synthase 10-like n=1 Tax=Prunus dulcis TaxID=3755 RepID=UPI0014830D64|nr:callose synthase 10-like [Prunus dulcis]